MSVMRGERLLARGRAAAESRMTDTCAISAAGSSAPVLNEETGEYEAAAPVLVYSGPCEVKAGSTAPHAIEAAGQALVEQQSTLKVPVDSSTAVEEGQTVVILTSATDPALPGKTYRIAGPSAGTHTTSRRFSLEEVS